MLAPATLAAMLKADEKISQGITTPGMTTIFLPGQFNAIQPAPQLPEQAVGKNSQAPSGVAIQGINGATPASA